MKFYTIFLVVYTFIINLNLHAQSTREYRFSADSVHIFATPTPVNSYYLPYNVTAVNKPLYAEPFTSNVSFPTLAKDIYIPAGNFPNTIFGGDIPGVLGFGFTPTSTIINDTYSSIDFPIILEADFFNRSSLGNHNESYFWLGNSNYTHFNPSNSILPSADVQQGIIIGGLPERSIISNSRSFLLPSIALINRTHNFADYNKWYKLKVVLDVTEDGRLVIYNIFIDNNCVLSDPIIVEKSDNINLNSFKLAICVDDFAKEFKVTKNADLLPLPNFSVCENGTISFGPDFVEDLCLDFNYFWDLPGSDVGTSNQKLLSNVRYNTTGVFESSLTLTNGEFTRKIPFLVKVESSFVNLISQQLCQGDSIFFNDKWIKESGINQQNLTSSNGCDSILTLDILVLDSIKTNLQLSICQGDTIEINQIKYSTQGLFIQNLTSSSGCDSTLYIRVKLTREDLLYDFNKCAAIVGTTNMDYSEFTSSLPGIACGTMNVSNLYRNNPLVNKHSCTPGLANTLAMCVESSSSCVYKAGDEKSVIFTIEITPQDDKYFQISKLKFFEKSPLNYDWINGPTGVNNFATKFGFRVLKNGLEIYRQEEIATQRDWNEHKIGFMNNENFIAKEKATYQFEFFPYCPIGNNAQVSVWDLENISIFTTCIDKENRIISGAVVDSEGNPIVNVKIIKENDLVSESIFTDINGNFVMSDIVNSKDCDISVVKNDDYLNGVTTLDLILIQRHILGLDIFDQSRKYVAADVNNDTRVSAADLVELRKLILGITDKFKQSYSWRFCTDLPAFNQNSKIELNEKYRIAKGAKDLKGLNFTGIKIGDVDNDSNFLSNTESRADKETLNFDIKKNNDDEYQISFYTTSPLELQGFQLSLDVENLEGVEVKNGQVAFGKEDFHYINNSINISYASPKPIAINDSQPFFSMVVKSPFFKPTMIGLNNNFKNELYDTNLLTKNVRINPLLKSDYSTFLKVKPNPFSNFTSIEYIALDSYPVNIQIYTITGSMVYSKTIDSNIGYNVLEISSDNLANVSGIYIVKMIINGESQNLKLTLK